MANSPLFQAGELVKMFSYEIFEENSEFTARVQAKYEFYVVESTYLVDDRDTYEYNSRTPYFSYGVRNVVTGTKHSNIPEHKLRELNDSEETFIRLLYAKK